jgi:phenylalanyl-tRNA synthetase beta chain
MRVPLDWLAEWIALPESLEELTERLTDGGLEVEEIERSGPDLSEIRVGSVLERAAHPNADRLSLCTVDIGDGKIFEVVCGAPNVAAGQKVAFAKLGTVLPDGTKLKKSKIRGVVSKGMICSESELGISDEHEGILVLDPGARVGAPLDRVLQVGETVIELAITPNRGDCASLIGIAREVQSHFGGELRVPECAPPETGPPASESIRIEVDDREGCHRYAGRVVRGVRVASSPDWLRERLIAAGLRPINNLVDITNLVLLEFGQPLHAFDLAKLLGGVVRVRGGRPGERLTTLEGETRELEPGDLVIADAERAIALAGVMGGADSEVDETTTDVLIESAHFQPQRVRRTARRLGLSTEASYRFERGVDREGIQRAADRAARLMAEIAGGEVCTGLVEARGEPPPATEQIALSPARLNRLLGTDLSEEAVDGYLSRVGVEPQAQADGSRLCRVPSHRNDLSIAEDLIEEVARIHGYDRIPATLQSGPLVEGRIPGSWTLSDRIREGGQAEGLIEVASLPFMQTRDLDGLGLEQDDPRRSTLRVLNPLVADESQMRSTLAPSMLHLVRENLNRQAEEVRLFEVSRVFRARKEDPGELPEERLWLGVAITRGEERRLWEARDPVPLFFEASGAAERLLARLGHAARVGGESGQPYLHPGASAAIDVGKRAVGWVGELHPDAASHFEIEVPCALLEVDLSAIESLPTQDVRYREVSRHPQVRRDLAVLVDRAQPAGEILEAIRKQGGSHFVSVEVFDRYEGRGIPEGRVSLAFRLIYQRPDRALTEAEVAKSVDRTVQMLANRFGGELR